MPRWGFSTPSDDTDTEKMTVAKSADPIDCSALNSWTQLTGVYDEVAKQIRLYVNGYLSDFRPSTGWHAGGGLQLGRAKYRGAYTDYFTGDIDDVHVYTGVLTGAEIAALAQGPPVDG
ncbi:LamG domain-containing protein [Sphaerisporangium corydalis]|uniref:LamG domain-containing protein n=1 Tax=Sphaerisporangium corydalis TaxID=1441875 RepID=A0ABV9EMF7_9ACTN|nr:LamG domain-containing protein [Sphaerisporangium corydalis]